MDMEKLVALCRRRGFIFQSSEIYGGINGFWDYGPLGVELKKNIKDAWWQDMVRNPPPGPDGQEIAMVGVDCSIIMNPKVWEASGHVGGFADPMVDCREAARLVSGGPVVALLSDLETHVQERLEHRCVTVLLKWASEGRAGTEPARSSPRSRRGWRHAIRRPAGQPPRYAQEFTLMHRYRAIAATGLQDPCPQCERGTLTEPRAFNLMFETHVGAVEDEETKVYLRPETAQGIFVNFRNVLDSTRLKLPFGIAQVGKAFRNEINPRNYTFRSREFEQMEIEFFCHPAESMKWYEYWRDVRKNWYTQLGIKSDKLRPREQGKDELAHYSIGTTDIEYLFPFAEEPQELEGVAHRGAYDLTQHMKHSGKDLSYFDEEAWERDKAGRGTNSFKEWLKTNPPQGGGREVPVHPARHRAVGRRRSLHAGGAVRGLRRGRGRRRERGR